VPGDVFRRDGLGQFEQRGAALGPFVEERTERLDDLLPPAVADSEGDVRAGRAVPAHLDGELEFACGAVREHVQVPGNVHLPGGFLGELDGHELLDHPHQVGHLGAVAAREVLGGADEYGDMADARLLAPAQHLLRVFGPVLVPEARRRQAVLPGPSPVAVHDDANVPGQCGARQFAAEPAGVQAVEKPLATDGDSGAGYGRDRVAYPLGGSADQAAPDVERSADGVSDRPETGRPR